MRGAVDIDRDASLSGMWNALDNQIKVGVATTTPITRYVHPDNLGSTAVTSDAGGNLAQRLDYAPYGSVIASENTGTTTAARQYIGQYFDPSSNLNYLNSRYYNSAQGQFISEDPVFSAIGKQTQVQQLSQQQNELLMDPQALNSYSYSEDNPVIKEDPNGKFVELLPVIAAAYLVYSAAQFGVDSYNAYNMDVRYRDVTSQTDKDLANLQVGFDMVSFGTGEGLARAGLEVSDFALSTAQASEDALNTFGPSVYSFFSNLFSENGTSNGPPNVSMSQLLSTPNTTFSTLYSNLSSNSVTSRQTAVSTINTGSGVSGTPSNELWVTPNGAVVTWTGQIVSSAAPVNSSSKQ
jgi:RHS repeat-associated protein